MQVEQPVEVEPALLGLGDVGAGAVIQRPGPRRDLEPFPLVGDLHEADQDPETVVPRGAVLPGLRPLQQDFQRGHVLLQRCGEVHLENVHARVPQRLQQGVPFEDLQLGIHLPDELPDGRPQPERFRGAGPADVGAHHVRHVQLVVELAGDDLAVDQRDQHPEMLPAAPQAPGPAEPVCAVEDALQRRRLGALSARHQGPQGGVVVGVDGDRRRAEPRLEVLRGGVGLRGAGAAARAGRALPAAVVPPIFHKPGVDGLVRQQALPVFGGLVLVGRGGLLGCLLLALLDGRPVQRQAVEDVRDKRPLRGVPAAREARRHRHPLRGGEHARDLGEGVAGRPLHLGELPGGRPGCEQHRRGAQVGRRLADGRARVSHEGKRRFRALGEGVAARARDRSQPVDDLQAPQREGVDDLAVAHKVDRQLLNPARDDEGQRPRFFVPAGGRAALAQAPDPRDGQRVGEERADVALQGRVLRGQRPHGAVARPGLAGEAGDGGFKPAHEPLDVCGRRPGVAQGPVAGAEPRLQRHLQLQPGGVGLDRPRQRVVVRPRRRGQVQPRQPQQHPARAVGRRAGGGGRAQHHTVQQVGEERLVEEGRGLGGGRRPPLRLGLSVGAARSAAVVVGVVVIDARLCRGGAVRLERRHQFGLPPLRREPPPLELRLQHPHRLLRPVGGRLRRGLDRRRRRGGRPRGVVEAVNDDAHEPGAARPSVEREEVSQRQGEDPPLRREGPR